MKGGMEVDRVRNKCKQVNFHEKNYRVECSSTDDFWYGGNEEFEERITEGKRERLKIGEVEKGNLGIFESMKTRKREYGNAPRQIC